MSTRKHVIKVQYLYDILIFNKNFEILSACLYLSNDSLFAAWAVTLLIVPNVLVLIKMGFELQTLGQRKSREGCSRPLAYLAATISETLLFTLKCQPSPNWKQI